MAEFFTNVSNFFSWISETIATAFEYFLSFLESLLYGILALSQSMQWLTMIIGYMPVVIGACLTATVAVFVVKFLIGR